MLLSSGPAQFGIVPTADLPTVWAALMEMGLEAGAASLVAVADDTVSLYTSTGGGVIGAGEHANVRAAARVFLECAERSLDAFVQSRSFDPPPTAGYVVFVALTHSGKLTAHMADAELRAERHPLSACYRAAHDVITQLRLTAPA